jgi:hypothetical protein
MSRRGAQPPSSAPPWATERVNDQGNETGSPASAPSQPGSGSAAPPWALHYVPESELPASVGAAPEHLDEGGGTPERKVRPRGGDFDKGRRSGGIVPVLGQLPSGNMGDAGGGGDGGEGSGDGNAGWKRPLSMAPDWTSGGGQELLVPSPNVTGRQAPPSHPLASILCERPFSESLMVATPAHVQVLCV